MPGERKLVQRDATYFGRSSECLVSLRSLETVEREEHTPDGFVRDATFALGQISIDAGALIVGTCPDVLGPGAIVKKRYAAAYSYYSYGRGDGGVCAGGRRV
jgi:hypothetical protein